MKWRSCLWVAVLATVAVAGIVAGAATVINVPGNYATIQAAIDAASTGDTIAVAAGTYAENVNVNKSVTLSGAPGAIVQKASGWGFQVAAPNITIVGFEVKGCATGIQTIGAAGVDYGTLTLRNTYVHDNTVNGVLVTDSLFATIAIENCRIVANSQNGIGIANKTQIGALNITDTTVDGNGGHGMFLANVAITSVDIQDSSFTNSSAYGMSGITLGTTASQIGAFLMQGGSLSGNRGAGLTVAQAASTFTSLTLDGVAITSNRESGILLGGGASAGSLTLDGCTFQGNAWEDLDLSGGWWGAFSVTGTTEIINNTFAAGPAWAAIYVGDVGAFGGQLYIAGNSFRPGWAIYSVNGKLIDAVNNWWGSASGPNVVAYASSSVVYSPWLANNTAAETWVFIVDDVGPIGSTGYLKPALDWALDGDLVCIRAGQYGVPKVEIREDYFILGAGAAGTVLVPTENALGSGDAGAWFLVKAEANTVLSGATLDGTGALVRQAIRTRGSGSITDNVIENIRSAQYEGWGIAFAYDTTGQDWTIARNLFQNIERVGVLVDGQGNRATIDSNLFLGNGDGDWVGYGVEVGDGAEAFLTGNTITGYRGIASVDSSISGAVLVTSYFGPNPQADLSLNVLTGNSYGLLVGYYPDDTSVVTAHYNSISGNTQGGADSSGPLVDASLNWWGSPQGPTHTSNVDGAGDRVSDHVIFSPWLGTDPDGNPGSVGVQIVAPMLIIVAPVGPAPADGYLNAAIGGSNEITGVGTHTIEVRHGTYAASTPITNPVNIRSEPGSASHTTLTGAMSIKSGGVLIGAPLQGFRILGNITVEELMNAASSKINWSDLYGTIANKGTGTFDAKYNFWGTQEYAVIDARTIGDIAVDPYLPKNADDSYNDVVVLINAGMVGSVDGAIQQLWAMDQLGQDVGTFIDYQGVAGAGAFQSLPPGSQITVGGAGGGGGLETTIAGTYAVGDIIDGRFMLTDPITGLPVEDALVTVSLLGPAGNALAFWGVTTYDASTGEYVFQIDTSGLAPGSYEMIIQTADGQTETLTIEIEEP